MILKQMQEKTIKKTGFENMNFSALFLAKRY